MQHQLTNQLTLGLFLFLFSAGTFVSQSAEANEAITTTKSANASSDEAKVQAAYMANFGYKPEYFEDAGRYFEQVVRLSTAVTKDVNLSLWGDVVSVNGPEASTEIQDTLIRLSMPNVVKRGNTALQWRLSWLVPTSKSSQAKDLKGRASTRLALVQTMGDVNIAFRTFFRKYLYAETEDVEGNANRDYEVKNTAALSYAFAKDFDFSLSATNVNRFFHFGPRRDYYETGMDIGYQITEKLSSSAGISTAESQVKDSQQNTAKLYVKDITEAAIGLTYSF